VDCWIGVVQQTDPRLMRLAGRLSAGQVPELLGFCAEIAQVDLTDLVSADAAGIEAAAAAKPWRLAAQDPGRPKR
jgi:hypothetical protein